MNAELGVDEYDGCAHRRRKGTTTVEEVLVITEGAGGMLVATSNAIGS
jgi:hypothetical protein